MLEELSRQYTRCLQILSSQHQEPSEAMAVEACHKVEVLLDALRMGRLPAEEREAVIQRLRGLNQSIIHPLLRDHFDYIGAEERAEQRTVTCACGAIWPWERFKEDSLEDCPHCKPEEWQSALSLCANVVPIGFVR